MQYSNISISFPQPVMVKDSVAEIPVNGFDVDVVSGGIYSLNLHVTQFPLDLDDSVFEAGIADMLTKLGITANVSVGINPEAEDHSANHLTVDITGSTEVITQAIAQFAALPGAVVTED